MGISADNAQASVKAIKDTAGEYQKWALETRAKFLELRLRQDPEIRGLYIRAADRVARELKNLVTSTPSGQLRKKHLQQLEKRLRAEAKAITDGLSAALTGYISQAVGAGAGYSQAVTASLLSTARVRAPGIGALNARVNLQAVEACWARTKNGLKLSDRIWEKGESFRTTIRDLIQEGVAVGQDAVKTAQAIERYVRTDARTLARQYPRMMERMRGRIPGDVSYEALRLVRTETTAAFGEGTIAAASVSPSYRGMRWVLSKAHPERDICDELAAHDEGLGKGVYAPGAEPAYPAHPHCICVLIPVHEQPDEFVKRLHKWQQDPTSEPELEKWFSQVNVGAAQQAPKKPAPKTKRSPKKSASELEIERVLQGAPLNDRSVLARHLLDAAGMPHVPVRLQAIPDRGTCAFDEIGGKGKTLQIVLQSTDGRPRHYQLKTVFHETTHARMDTGPLDVRTLGSAAWVDVEETVVESVAHFMAKKAGIAEEIVPSYAQKLVTNLPKLKRLPEFKRCKTIADFGKVLAAHRYDQRNAAWSQLSSYLTTTKIDIGAYAAQYESYVQGHIDEIVDRLFDNQGTSNLMLKPVIRQSVVNGWGKPYNLNETGFWESLAVAMNRLGVK